MDKDKALALFYAKNGIDYQTASDEEDGNYDHRIADLPDQIDRWLANIDTADHSLFLELLSQYTYLTEPQCQLRYSRLLSMFEGRLAKLQMSLSDVLFVTVESGNGRTSGADNVSADFRKRNMRKLEKGQIIVAQSRLSAEDFAQYKAVFFLDDIIGSGKTLWKEIESFCKRFDIPNTYDPVMFYACIAPRKRGVKHIDKNCKKSNISIEKLFDDAWIVEPAFARNSKEYLQIEKYEKMVGEYMTEPPKSFFMGFDKNRLLFSFHYNTPNNTLSTFWREIPEKHFPPFCRDGDQPPKLPRPTLDTLKERESAMRQGAYEQGRAIRRKEDYNE